MRLLGRLFRGRRRAGRRTQELVLELADRLTARAAAMGEWRILAAQMLPIMGFIATHATTGLQLGEGSNDWAIGWLAAAQRTGLIARPDGTYAGPPAGAERLLAGAARTKGKLSDDRG